MTHAIASLPPLAMALPTLNLSPDLLQTILFAIFAALTGGSAIMLVATKNIVRMAVALLMTLLGIGGLYFLLNAEFLAAVQLVVYAGGTLILIVFGVMLTSNSPFSRFEPSLLEKTLAILAAIILLASLLAAILSATGGEAAFANAALPSDQPYPMDALGQALLGDYLLPFELSSVLLLVVMIGAAFLAKGRRRETAADPFVNLTANDTKAAR